MSESKAKKENRFFKDLPNTGKGIIVGRIVDGIYRPPLMHRLLKPRISGNALNGLGESTPRRVGKVYHWVLEGPRGYPWFWANIPFQIRSYLERAFDYGSIVKRAISLAKTTDEINAKPLPNRVDAPPYSPSEWSQLLKAKALDFGAGDVGICRVTEDMLFENRDSPGKFALMIAVPMNHEYSQHLPRVEGAKETIRAYCAASEVALKLMNWLRDQGVVCQAGTIAPDKLVLIPAAIQAGLGELGKHGSVIHPRMGSLVRFNYVSFDIEVDIDHPIDFGADDFCTRCKVCTQHCPPQAMLDEKQLVRGVEKWYVDFDKCVPYFNDTLGCGICLAVCPFSLPEKGINLVAKLARKRQKLSAAESA